MRPSLSAIFVTLGLAGCGGGGGGAPPAEEPSPTAVALGNIELRVAFGTSSVIAAVTPVLGQGASSTPTLPLFDSLVFTEADAGRTFVVASVADDPDFGPLAALLTNGVDDDLSAVMRYGTGGFSLVADNESLLIVGAAGPLTPDFQGATITRIELRVEVLSLDTPGRDLNADGVWTDLSATLRFVFFGVR